MIDVLGPEKRRRRTTQEKIAIVQQSFEPGMTVSLVARQHGVAASQLFLWRKQYQEGSLTAVTAGEQIVPASELAAAIRQIKERQRLLGTKRWKMNSLKKPLNMDVQKVDSARALVAGVMHWAVTTGGFNSETAQDVMPGAVERRFGNELPASPVEWLTDNGSCYRANETRQFARMLGLEPKNTAVRSPESNKIAESFVKTIKRDYIVFMPKPDVNDGIA